MAVSFFSLSDKGWAASKAKASSTASVKKGKKKKKRLRQKLVKRGPKRSSKRRRGDKRRRLKTIAKKPRKTPSQWLSASLGYSLATDFAEEAEPRAYRHSFSLSPSLSLGAVRIDTGVYVRYASLGSQIQSESSDLDSDFFLGGGMNFPLGRWLNGEHSASVGLSLDLPYSEEARLNGFRWVPGASVALSSKFWGGRYTLSNSLSLTHIVNEFEFSQITLESNPEWTTSYSMGHRLKVWRGLAARVSIYFSNTRFLNGANSFSFGNSLGLGYGWKGFSFNLGFSNHRNAQRDEISLWFIDKGRRLVRASLSYSF